MSDVQLNTIYNEDCLDTMKRMPDGFVDVVVTSPPYNMRLNASGAGYKERGKESRYSGKYREFSDAMPMDDYRDYHSKIINELCRVSNLVFWNVQIVTGNKDAIFQILGIHHRQIRDVIVWDKGHGQPAMNTGMLNRGYELIIVFEPNGQTGRKFHTYEFERGTLEDVWRFGRGGKGDVKGHGAVFPLSLVSHILVNFSKPGAIIYDPFMGTGTTARAALDLQRNYIGSEICQEYCDIAEQRLRQKVLL